MTRSSILDPRSSILHPPSSILHPPSSILDFLSIFYLGYYIGASVALIWAGNYLTNNGDRMGLKLALPRKRKRKE
jgi:hypothetical protein